MRGNEGFKQLLAWQRAYELAIDILRTTSHFPRSQAHTLTQQMQRAAISVSANIAEGYDRGHRKEYVQFLKIARGSLSELETYLLMANDLGFLKTQDFETLEEKRKQTGRLLKGLINALSP